MEEKEAISRIRAIDTIDEKAKDHMVQLVDFCEALHGEVSSIRAPEDIFKEYPFATVYCSIREPVVAEEIRRHRNKIDVLTKTEWMTLHLEHSEGPPNEIVIFQDFKRAKPMPTLKYYYMDKTGMDYVEGSNIQIRGFSAAIQRDGNYLNMSVV